MRENPVAEHLGPMHLYGCHILDMSAIGRLVAEGMLGALVNAIGIGAILANRQDSALARLFTTVGIMARLCSPFDGPFPFVGVQMGDKTFDF